MTINLKRQLDAKVNRKVGKAIKKLSSSKELGKLADQAIKQIQIRTGRGYGVGRKEGAEGKFRELAPSTIGSRKRKGNKRTRSNLTDTGEMINSIKYRIVSGIIELFLSGTRNDGRKVELTNDELADIHQTQGAGKTKVKRPFFHISAKDLRKLRFTIRQRLKFFLKI